MHDEDSFLRAVQAAPDDGDLLLIYADWLDEQGDSPRADFLRLREALKKLSREDTQYLPLWRRMHELRPGIDRSWIETLVPHPWDDWTHSPFLEPDLADHVRRRPGMYIGDVSATGLNYMLFGLIEGAASEMNAELSEKMSVEFLSDGSCCVSTDGLPLDLISGRLALGVPTTRSGWKTASHYYLSVHVLCALSEYCRVEAVILGHAWRQDYRRGIAVGTAAYLGLSAANMTKVTFLPDKEIFSSNSFDSQHVANRLTEIGHLSKGHWQARVIDHREPTRSQEIPKGSLPGFLAVLEQANAADSEPCCAIIDVMADSRDCWMRLALRWNARPTESVRVYANYIQIQGGRVMHIAPQSIGRVVRQLLVERGVTGIRAADYRSGLSAVLTIVALNLEYEGATKTRLSDPDIAAFVYREVRDGLTCYFNEHPAEADRVCARVLEAREQRLARRQPLESK